MGVYPHGYLRNQDSCLARGFRFKDACRLYRRHKAGDSPMPATRAKQNDIEACIPVPFSENTVIQSATTNAMILIGHR